MNIMCQETLQERTSIIMPRLLVHYKLLDHVAYCYSLCYWYWCCNWYNDALVIVDIFDVKLMGPFPFYFTIVIFIISKVMNKSVYLIDLVVCLPQVRIGFKTIQ